MQFKVRHDKLRRFTQDFQVELLVDSQTEQLDAPRYPQSVVPPMKKLSSFTPTRIYKTSL